MTKLEKLAATGDLRKAASHSAPIEALAKRVTNALPHRERGFALAKLAEAELAAGDGNAERAAELVREVVVQLDAFTKEIEPYAAVRAALAAGRPVPR